MKISDLIYSAKSIFQTPKLGAPSQAPTDSFDFNPLLYNYSGDLLPKLSAIGLPAGVATPELPTSIPTNAPELALSYSPPAVKRTAIGLPVDTLAPIIPISVPGQGVQPISDLAATNPPCSLCNAVVRGLLGGTLRAAAPADANISAQ